jgi:acyl dehydratase
MAVAMRDPNPVHVEDDLARRAGLPTAIAHGTFAVSYVGMAVSRAVGVRRLDELDVRLLAPVFPGDALRATATAIPDDRGAQRADVELHTGDGRLVARGTVRFRSPETAR